MDPDVLFRIVDVTGVICNGLLGAAVARKHGFDIIGFLVLGTCTALGGGLFRDMMLGTGFPVALTDPWYLGGAFTASAIAYFIPLESKWWQRGLALGDVLALGCWSATGASKAISAGLGIVPAIFLGVVTACCGGIIRDIMVNRIPAIFGGHPLYATFSVIAATQMAFLQLAGYYEIGMGSAIISCAILGLAARKYRWILPKPYNLTNFKSRGKHQKD
ncbi:MAG: TRIC cation channel family protein [Arcanobacterium sp.]|nr:TRIC cation channel family protein [Arcanobacterium sp.]